MPALVAPETLAQAIRFKQISAHHQQNRDLINIGAYVRGSDGETDFYLEHRQEILEFLRQGMLEKSGLEEARLRLERLLKQGPS